MNSDVFAERDIGLHFGIAVVRPKEKPIGDSIESSIRISQITDDSPATW